MLQFNPCYLYGLFYHAIFIHNHRYTYGKNKHLPLCIYHDYITGMQPHELETEFYLHFTKCIAHLLCSFTMSIPEIILQENESHFRKASFLGKINLPKELDFLHETINDSTSLKQSLKEQIPHSKKNEGLIYFLSALRAHHEFISVIQGDNATIFNEIVTFTQKTNFVSSDYHKIIALINRLIIPGIQQIKLESTLSAYGVFLEQIDFPVELISHEYQQMFSNKDQQDYPYEVNVWFSKVQYLHKAFKDKQFIEKCHKFAKFLNESEFSLTCFVEDLRYELAQKDSGLFVRNKKATIQPGCILATPLPPLHRCLKILLQHQNSGLHIPSTDLEKVKIFYKFDIESWLAGPKIFFRSEMLKLYSDYERSAISITAILTQIKSKSAPKYVYKLPMDFTLPIDEGINEVLRRVPKEQLASINLKLSEVSSEHLTALKLWLDNPKKMLTLDSFIHDPMFPFTALSALIKKDISTYQFGTMMNFWGNLATIFDPNLVIGKPIFIALFDDLGAINPTAAELLPKLIDFKEFKPFIDNEDFLIDNLFLNARQFPKSEQGFWVVSYKDLPSQQSIKYYIKDKIIRFLDFPEYIKYEIFTTFGVQQALTNAACEDPVRLNPVIGNSKVSDIKKGSVQRYRDVQIPFPGVECPKTADKRPCLRSEDFIYHDKYHQIRASLVSPKETEITIALSTRMEELQLHYKAAAIILEKIHNDNLILLKSFFTKFKKTDSSGSLIMLLKYTHKQFNQEIKLINYCSNLSLSFGKLKFILYDMERIKYTNSSGFKLDALRSLGHNVLEFKSRKIFPKFCGHAAYDHFQLTANDLPPLNAVINDNIYDEIAHNFTLGLYERSSNITSKHN